MAGPLEKSDWRLTNYDLLKENDSWKRSFREGGVDLPGMLEAQVRGEVDSWAIRWTHTHFVHHAVCLVPVDSLVNNCGIDGSGTHMGASRRYFHESLNGKKIMSMPPLVYVDPIIARAYKTAERRGFSFRVVRRFARVSEDAWRRALGLLH